MSEAYTLKEMFDEVRKEQKDILRSLLVAQTKLDTMHEQIQKMGDRVDDHDERIDIIEREGAVSATKVGGLSALAAAILTAIISWFINR